MAQIKGQTFPDDLFLVRDENDKINWYRLDPMKHPGPNNQPIPLEDLLFDFFGEGNTLNPVLIRIQGVKYIRGEDFSISLPGAIRKGIEDKHFEDLEGSYVDIIEARNQNNLDFPINGVILSAKGEVLGIRNYNFKGQCADGIKTHRIVVVKGALALFTEKEKPADTEPESEKPAAEPDNTPKSTEEINIPNLDPDFE